MRRCSRTGICFSATRSYLLAPFKIGHKLANIYTLECAGATNSASEKMKKYLGLRNYVKYKDDDVKGDLCMRGWVLQRTAQPAQPHAPSVSAGCENTESRVPGEISGRNVQMIFQHKMKE